MQALGRYQIVRPIASGGMATVYLGRVSGEGGFERLVAIKLMHQHIANEPEFVAMFLDEARVAARIRHPNVVPTLAVERSPDGLFLVMEYVEGYALHHVLRTLARAGTMLPIGVALRVVIDLIEGLHAAHELRDDSGAPLNIVHRDVSPQNVLLGKDGVARITDFGVAHARSRLATTQGASLKGKVAYACPEQVVTGKVDRRSDLFSAGIVLWEVLTRRRLFRGDTEGQTLAQIILGAKKSPRDVNPNVPEPISAVCMKMLAPNPDQRFPTGIEAVDALERAARESQVEIAKPREVAVLLASWNIPDPPVEVGRTHGTGSTASTVESASLPLTGAAPMVSSTPAPRPPSRMRLFGILGVGAMVVLAAGALLVRSRGTARPPEPGARGATSSLAAPGQLAVGRASTDAPASPSAVVPQPAATAPASASASAPTSPSAVPSTRPDPRKQPSEPRTGKPSAPKGGTGYRPEGL